MQERREMLDRFWKERIDDFDLRSKIGVGDSLGTDDVRPVLQQVAEMTEGLSGRSLMQLMNGVHTMHLHAPLCHLRLSIELRAAWRLIDDVARGPFCLTGVQSEMLVKGGQGLVLERDDVLTIARRKMEESRSGTESVDTVSSTLKV